MKGVLSYIQRVRLLLSLTALLLALVFPNCEDEGLSYTESDSGKTIVSKQFQDVVGYYSRFDVFEFKVNRRAHQRTIFTEESSRTTGLHILRGSLLVSSTLSKFRLVS